MIGLSSIYFVDFKGNFLVSRSYKDDVNEDQVTRFITRLIDEQDELALKPILEENSVSFIHIKIKDIFIIATATKNPNAAMIVVYLYKLVNVLKQYFSTIEAESIKDNFVIILELLDEMMDNGCPQTTEPNILKEYITQESYELKEVRPPPAVTLSVNWRPDGIYYPKNEIFLDLVEKINLQVNNGGDILHSEVIGVINVNCKLSGMPTLQLGFNDRFYVDKNENDVELEGVSFHHCVRMAKYESDKTISFIPPDGKFELLTYRLHPKFKPIIHIDANIKKFGSSRYEYIITARSQFKKESLAKSVKIVIPVPNDVTSPLSNANFGKVRYRPESDCLIWKIKQFPGGKEYTTRITFNRSSIVDEDLKEEKLPIRVSFSVPSFTISGIQVRHLRIHDASGYSALPWVRYMTTSGDYLVRI